MPSDDGMNWIRRESAGGGRELRPVSWAACLMLIRFDAIGGGPEYLLDTLSALAEVGVEFGDGLAQCCAAACEHRRGHLGRSRAGQQEARDIETIARAIRRDQRKCCAHAAARECFVGAAFNV